MKIKNKVLALAVSVAMLTGCSASMTTKTVTKPNGEVEVTKEFKTSKNHSVIKAVQTVATIVAVVKVDAGTGGLLNSMVQLHNHKKSLELEYEKYLLDKEKEVTKNAENT